MNTTDDLHDLIEAFADGESVDPLGLERALADPDGRSHLIDVLVLRGFAIGPGAMPAAAAIGGSRGAARSMRWWSLAAAFVAMAAIGGYVLGSRNVTRAPAPTSSSTANAQPATTEAPDPTTVIRFQPGVDWTEIKGGH